MKRSAAAVAGSVFISIMFALIADQLFPPPIDDVEYSVVVTDRYHQPLRIFPVADGWWRLAAELKDIDPRFIKALIAIEDQRFFDHHGVDNTAVLRAIRDNLSAGKIVSGASTITMQTARLLEPRPRTFRSKVLEALRALQIEKRLTKEEILELYLSLTPYGGNLEGLRSATWSYLGRDPKNLTDSDIALLLALPQSPEVRRPDRYAQNARRARRVILDRLSAAHILSVQRAHEADTDPLPQTRRAFPGSAWHFSEKVQSFSEHNGKTPVQTTIDKQIQDDAKRLCKDAAIAAGPNVQCAMVVAQIQDRSILASVGSAMRDRPGGWLDLTARRRSPGSTLKPLIYGLAMDEGLVNASTRLTDKPMLFGQYSPENFNHRFYGELTIEQALQHSLNVPAVLLLDALGPDRFVGSLKNAGLSPQLPQRFQDGTGLAVALGGLGVTMEELVQLYAGLADGGRVRPLKRLANIGNPQESQISVPVISTETSESLLEILRLSSAPHGQMPRNLARGAPRIAFKTGTSYGHRDTWAIGVGERHVIAIWLGRADGAPRPGATGRRDALPLLFDTFDIVEPLSTLQGMGISSVNSGPDKLTAAEEPKILFPPDGARLWQDPQHRPFVLAGRSEKGRWFVNGTSLRPDKEGNLLWTPEDPGFYTLTLSDKRGRVAQSSVRIQTLGE